jgi:hypothetical protein
LSPSLTVELPTRMASYVDTVHNHPPARLRRVLDLEELLRWMKDEAKLDPDDAQLQAEAKAIMALFRRHSILPPSTSTEFFHDAIEELRTCSGGFNSGATWNGSKDMLYRARVIWLVLGLFSAVTLAALVIVLLRINRWGFRRGREILDAQEKALSAPEV